MNTLLRSEAMTIMCIPFELFKKKTPSKKKRALAIWRHLNVTISMGSWKNEILVESQSDLTCKKHMKGCRTAQLKHMMFLLGSKRNKSEKTMIEERRNGKERQNFNMIW